LLTPGHTPDSLCLLDRQNRILFVGDTFYPGPIYLCVPETDVAAYERSIGRLATLVPQLDILLTSHNLPLSRPEMLLRLSDAFRQVRTGNARFTVSGAQREYADSTASLCYWPTDSAVGKWSRPADRLQAENDLNNRA